MFPQRLMVGFGSDLACPPPPPQLAALRGGSVAAPRPLEAAVGSAVDRKQTPSDCTPLRRSCWHGEQCPWHARGMCFWGHSSPLAADASGSSSFGEMTAAIHQVGCRLDVAVVQLNSLAEGLGVQSERSRSFELRIGKAEDSRCEFHSFQAQFQDLASQFEGLKVKSASADVGSYEKFVEVLGAEVHDLEAKAGSNFACLSSALKRLEEKLDGETQRGQLARTCLDGFIDDVAALRASSRSLRGGPSDEQRHLACGNCSPTSFGSERGCVRQAHQSSSFSVDVGGCGFQGGGGGEGVAGMDEPAPPSVHGGGGGGGVVAGASGAASSPQSAADVEAAIARLSFVEIARRFQLLPEVLRGGGADQLSISRSLLALQPL